MFNSNFAGERGATRKTDIIIPLIRTAATIGFAVAPCSLGFVIIAISDQLIRAIMVGEDPVMLMGDLQNQFPDHALEVADANDTVVAQVVDMIDQPDCAVRLPLDTHNGVALRC